jgi:hypothetical protein
MNGTDRVTAFMPPLFFPKGPAAGKTSLKHYYPTFNFKSRTRHFLGIFVRFLKELSYSHFLLGGDHT